MSRHQSHRRRSYGRRQHELHERRGRGAGFEPDDGLDQPPAAAPEPGDPFAAYGSGGPVFDLFSSRLRFAEGRG